MTLGDNIKAARTHAKLTQQAIADIFGIKRASVAQWENGSTTPGLMRTGLLAKNLGYSVDYFMSNEFDPQVKMDAPHATSEAGTIPSGSQFAKSTAIVIKQYTDVSGSMGQGITLRDQPGQITEWMVTTEWINKNIPANTGNKNLRIITGFGDSMRGMFNSGDPLIVDVGVNAVEYDGVYFFRVKDEGFIKRLQRVPGRGLLAISENKAYESWVITDDMDFEVFGRVLKVWKSEDF